MEYAEGAGEPERISQSYEVAELATLGAKRVETDMTELASLWSSWLSDLEVVDDMAGR